MKELIVLITPKFQLNNRIFTFGGIPEFIEEFDPSAMVWMNTTFTMNSPRANFVTATIDKCWKRTGPV